jgi:hypothetical protein
MKKTWMCGVWIKAWMCKVWGLEEILGVCIIKKLGCVEYGLKKAWRSRERSLEVNLGVWSLNKNLAV